MDLPNYFIADLPDDADLTPAMMANACETLQRNRDTYLTARSTNDLITALEEMSRHWLDPDYPLRKWALEQSPAATGFTPEIVARGLDAFFKQLTRENLEYWIKQEFGHLERLDSLVSNADDKEHKRAAKAIGPRLTAHITAGTIPNPTFMSIVSGLLVRSSQFVKCAQGMQFLTRLFGHSLYEVDSKLGACLEIAAWPGGHERLEAPLFGSLECVTATGSDETISAIRNRLQPGQRFLGYGNKVSFAFVTHQAPAALSVQRLIDRAAADIVHWDQLGCLSPHLIYVQKGGNPPPEIFAKLLAEKLQLLEEQEPRRPLSVQESARIKSARNVFEIRAAHLQETTTWFSDDSTAWTVVYDDDPSFQFSCLNRFVYVKAVSDLAEALNGAEMVREKVSTVGLAATQSECGELAAKLADWGASRICPLGQMQNPPLAWRHDGRPALADLITWTDWEFE